MVVQLLKTDLGGVAIDNLIRKPGVLLNLLGPIGVDSGTFQFRPPNGVWLQAAKSQILFSIPASENSRVMGLALLC